MMDIILKKALVEIVAQDAKLIVLNVKPLKDATNVKLVSSSHSTKHATKLRYAWLDNTFPRVNLHAKTAALIAFLVIQVMVNATLAREDSTYTMHDVLNALQAKQLAPK
jgi:hypothetical protein